MKQLFVLSIGLLMFASSPAQADCDRPPSALPALKQSDVVFRGRVRDVKTVGTPPGRVAMRGGWTGWIVTFEVSRVWKGLIEKQFVLHTTAETDDDAFTDFEPGKEYLVFAAQNLGLKAARFGLRQTTYGAHGCGGTVSVSQGAKYLLELGTGRPPDGGS